MNQLISQNYEPKCDAKNLMFKALDLSKCDEKKNIIFSISKCVKYLGTRPIFNRNELAYNTKEDDNIRRSMKNPSLLDHPFSFIKKSFSQ